MRTRVFVFVLAWSVVAGAASLATAASTQWRNLQTVTVTLQNPSLPPPGGAAHTTRFTSAGQLRKVTKALNANHIAKGPDRNSGGCAGGQEVTIKIVPKHGSAVTLSGYDCSGGRYGDIAGNVSRFLNAIGLDS